MADILTLSSAEKDPGKIANVARQLAERLPAAEAAIANAASKQVIAGAGLTGGGDLTADRTLNVGAGTGITVNADDVAISTDGVTNTLLANMATKTYKGRTSGSTGDPEDVSADTVRSDISAEKIGEVTGINTQTASYTLVLADKGKTVEMNVGSGNNFNVPANVTVAFPVGTYINITQLGAGQTTIVPAGGVTIRSYNSGLKLSGQYAMATLYKRATDEWVAGGNLTP